MYDRIRNLLHLMMDLLVALVVLGLGIAYIGICSFIMTQVINDLRLDTYVDFGTGFGIVNLVLFLGWVPVWLLRAQQERLSQPRTGKL